MTSAAFLAEIRPELERLGAELADAEPDPAARRLLVERREELLDFAIELYRDTDGTWPGDDVVSRMLAARELQ